MDYLEFLRCPRTGQTLERIGDALVNADRAWAYPIRAGVCVLLAEAALEFQPED